MLRQHTAQELPLPPSQTPSESPSLSPQPQPTSTTAAGQGPSLSAATSSAIAMPVQQAPNPTEGQMAAAQKLVQEQRPQLWPLTGGALVAAAGLMGTGQKPPLDTAGFQPCRFMLQKLLSIHRKMSEHNIQNNLQQTKMSSEGCCKP